jgi:hypothetical protein
MHTLMAATTSLYQATMTTNIRSASIELAIRASFLEVGGEHAAEMLDRGAGLRTLCVCVCVCMSV